MKQKPNFYANKSKTPTKSLKSEFQATPPKSLDSNFSFSPAKSKEPALELAEILTSRPKNSEIPKHKGHTMTSLYDRAKEIAYNKEKKVRAMFDKIYPFKPKINGLSEKIITVAKQEGKDLRQNRRSIIAKPQPGPNETSFTGKQVLVSEFLDRNYTQELAKLEHRREPQFIPILDRIDEDCTFIPTLNVKSVEIAKKHKVNLYEKAVKSREDKKVLAEREMKKKEEKEKQECTFTPRIIKNSETVNRGHTRNKSDLGGYSERSKRRYASPFEMIERDQYFS
jgi:hypothetical protein